MVLAFVHLPKIPGRTWLLADSLTHRIAISHDPVYHGGMPLSDRQAALLIQALEAAFSLPALRKMLRQELNISLASITSVKDKHAAIQDLLAAAENEGWTDKLVQAARAAQPYDAGLRTAADALGLAPPMLVALRPGPLRLRHTNAPTLEKIIRSANSLLDVAAWREKLGRIEYQVCRIDLRDRPVGTGFLIGPDLVLTCYHVVETLIKGEDGPEYLTAIFDHKIAKDNRVLNPGSAFGLAPNWLVDSSPYNPEEARGVEDADILPDQLDYAVIRLKDSPGKLPVSDQAVDDRPRGWIELSDRPLKFAENDPLFIIQHPAGGPLKLALDTLAVLGLNANGTRLRYRTNTASGASGSPCFNSNWELVALHHSGIVKYNEGIPIDRIADLLKQRGHWPPA